MQDLIAPRPLRLTSVPSFARHLSSSPVSSLIRPKPPPPSVRLLSVPPTEAFTRISLSEGGNGDDQSPDSRDLPSSAFEELDPPPAREPTSPRLSPDALEEFLSILRPTVFNNIPSSPIVRPRYERPSPYRGWTHKRNHPSSTSASGEDANRSPELTTISRSNSCSAEERDEMGEEIVFDPRPWHYSSLLSSPVSRSHTQNPLARCVSQDFDVSSYLIRAVSPHMSSPAAFALAQSIPIPPSPSSQVSSRGSSPHPIDI